MMLTGRIAKQNATQWSAECDVIGSFTSGDSRADAIDMLRRHVVLQSRTEGYDVRVTPIGTGDDFAVLIDADDLGPIAAAVLRHQREIHRLTLADVATRLGVSLTSYAAYEQGKREPSLSKMRDLLAAIAPELAMTIGLVPGGRAPARRVTAEAPRATRRKAAR